MRDPRFGLSLARRLSSAPAHIRRGSIWRPRGSNGALAVQRYPYTRSFETSNAAISGGKPASPPAFFTEYKRSYEIKASFELSSTIEQQYVGRKVTVVGFLQSKNSISSGMTFVKLVGVTSTPLLKHISKPAALQVLFRRRTSEINDQACDQLGPIEEHSSVAVTGTLKIRSDRTSTPDARNSNPVSVEALEILADKIELINDFADKKNVVGRSPRDLEPRHLQIRLDMPLRYRLAFRQEMMVKARAVLHDFLEVETPVLFKSTPEGAREFLVPTRKPGYAYALPQSPQQYKQILMASGISKYFQFARCFRDEDYRADRQPEFTQLDLEMSWADGDAVMTRVESLVRSLYEHQAWLDPNVKELDPMPPGIKVRFPQMTHEEAMTDHGCDKPDLRNTGLIHRIDHLLPESLTRSLTPLKDPIIEVWRFETRPPFRPELMELKHFIYEFMSSADASVFQNNPDGAPGVFVVDSGQPLKGLSAFGFEAVGRLEQHLSDQMPKHREQVLQGPGLEGWKPTNVGEFNPENIHSQPLGDGEIIILQARPKSSRAADSTMLGRLRRAVFNAALERGFVRSNRPQLLWVTDFPMFTLNDDPTGPGQGSRAGIASSHHPFTAPKTAADVDLLLTNPLKARADHFDLVIDGIELGGGSRRIHNAQMQEFVMRDILKMPSERLHDFDHLFRALKSGCPPHAGFALGWDRLMAKMSGCTSIKDVMAFPKNARGEDLMVQSPGKVDKNMLNPYHIKLKD